MDRRGYEDGLVRIRVRIGADSCADWRGYVDGLVRIRGRTGADTWTDWCLYAVMGKIEQMAEYGAQADGEARMNRRDALCCAGDIFVSENCKLSEDPRSLLLNFNRVRWVSIRSKSEGDRVEPRERIGFQKKKVTLAVGRISRLLKI